VAQWPNSGICFPSIGCSSSRSGNPLQVQQVRNPGRFSLSLHISQIIVAVILFS
jgi:hypothetical protein